VKPIVIAYQEDWPERAARLIVQLEVVLGDLARRIEHIGSTAVPGMAAKDVLDLQVSVEDLDPAAGIFDGPLAERRNHRHAVGLPWGMHRSRGRVPARGSRDWRRPRNLACDDLHVGRVPAATPLSEVVQLTARVTGNDGRATSVECVLGAGGKDRARATVRTARVPAAWRHGSNEASTR